MRSRLYLAEFIGTAILLLVGLSLVIVMFGSGSPLATWIPSVKLRQTITGFLFGSTGAAIAVSWVGRESGAHINPVVTMAFWIARKIDTSTSAGYIGSQLAGGIAGSIPLLIWGDLGHSIAFGATTPGAGYSTTDALVGEIATTFALVIVLCVFLAFRHLRRFTPLAIPVLYAIMIPLEADISGTSTNPARSLGPSVVSGEWREWWIYWVGPAVGSLLAMLAASFLARRIEVAKLYHFDSDRDRIFRRMAKVG